MMSVKEYDKAYKAYDIRAIYDDPIDDTFAYSLWKWLGKYLMQTIWKDASLCFWSDVREANNNLIYWFLKWLEDGWCTNYIGLWLPVEAIDDNQIQLWWVCSSSMVYYFTKEAFDIGVVFTASHNPPEYVGMKIVDRQSALIPSQDLQSMVEAYEVVGEIDEDELDRIGSYAMGEDNPLSAEIEAKVMSYTSLLANKYSTLLHKKKIVVDFSTGAAVWYERMFFDEIIAAGHDVLYVNEKADSNFSAHLSDTTDPHDYEQLIAVVKESGADFGIMFDGDADRLGIVDNLWRIVDGDIVTGIIACAMLAQNPEQDVVVHDVFFRKSVLQKIAALWGKPVKSRVGHRFVKEQCKKHEALFGGELSWHLFFNEVGWWENPLMALYYVLQAMGENTLSSLVDTYLGSYKAPLRKYTVHDNAQKETILEHIKQWFSQYTIDCTDGVWVYADDFRFVLRPSNTEPVLKLVMEADTQDIWEEKISVIEHLMKE